MARVSVRQGGAALSLFVVVAGTVGYEFQPQPVWLAMASGALVVYLLAALPRLNRGSRMLLLGLLLGVGAVYLLELEVGDALFVGASRACLFAAFLAALGMLRQAAQGSRLIEQTGATVNAIRPSWRYLLLGGGGQLLSALLAAGALNILSTAVYRGSRDEASTLRPAARQLRERRMVTALLRGHCMAQSWAPTSMFVTLLLTMVPGLRWGLLLPYCVAMALLSLLLGWALDRLLFYRYRVATAPADAAPRPAVVESVALFALLAPLLMLFSLLCALVFALALLLDVRFIIAVVIGFPLFSIAWSLLQLRDRTAGPGAAGRAEALKAQLFNGFASQHNETALIGCSVFIGALVASQVSAAQIEALMATGLFSPVGLVIAAVWSIPLLSLVAINPMVTVTIVASLSTYIVEAHFPVVVFAVAILGAWSITAGLSPFAQPVLIVSRNLMRGPGQVGFAWNWLYSLAVMLVLTLWLYFASGTLSS